MAHNITFTPSERKAVDAAFQAVEYFASTTNWTDSSDWKAAFKLVRKDSQSVTEARARIVRAWHDGTRAVEMERTMASFPHSHAQHYVLAFVLGIKQYCERGTVDKFNDARALCPAAIAAYDEAVQRWIDQPMSVKYPELAQ